MTLLDKATLQELKERLDLSHALLQAPFICIDDYIYSDEELRVAAHNLETLISLRRNNSK